MKQWKERQCPNCGGHGLVSVYTADGADFEGAGECRDCNGTGRIFQSDKGVLVQYPGGPFVGRLSRKEMTA